MVMPGGDDTVIYDGKTCWANCRRPPNWNLRAFMPAEIASNDGRSGELHTTDSSLRLPQQNSPYYTRSERWRADFLRLRMVGAERQSWRQHLQLWPV